VGREDSRPGSGLFGDGEDAGELPWETSFMRLMKSMAWRFSRPPNWLGTHSPGFAGVVEVEHGVTASTRRPSMWYLSEPEERVEMKIVLDFGAGRN